MRDKVKVFTGKYILIFYNLLLGTRFLTFGTWPITNGPDHISFTNEFDF